MVTPSPHAIRDLTADDVQVFDLPTFVLKNRIVNENQDPIEFQDHYFLIEPYQDYTPEQVVMKASQVGWSVLEIIKALHTAQYRKANIIYTLPSKSVVKDFVQPKVDPIINNNDIIRRSMGRTDSTALKSIGKNFIYFRGSWEQSAAISISAHILINDEVDRSKPLVLRTYKTRLDEAKRLRPDLGWVWQFSNPSIPGAGVDERWQVSDQKHWFVKCKKCSYEWYLKWPDNINMDTKEYVCARCHNVLTREDRRAGRWVNKKTSDVSGYWISQMMAPWIPASKIIEDSKEDLGVFHNFTLGLPYISADFSVDRETIVKCLNPDTNPRTDVAMGVDNGVIKHYVIGNRYGIFKVGKTESWEEIEDLRNRYGAYMCIDMNPYPHTPAELIRRYRGRVFGNYYFEDTKKMGTIRWLDGDDWGIVHSDRVQIIDQVVSALNAQDILFNLTLTELENSEYIYQWTQLYRTTEKNLKGMVVPKWKTIEGKPDHYAHATVYWYIALQKTLSAGGVVRPKPPTSQDPQHPTVSVDSRMPSINPAEVARRMARRQKLKKRQ